MVSVDKIMDYESGEMNEDEMIKMFAEMIKDGSVWRLQGCYGRQAKNLIDNGIISTDGEVI